MISNKLLSVFNFKQAVWPPHYAPAPCKWWHDTHDQGRGSRDLVLVSRPIKTTFLRSWSWSRPCWSWSWSRSRPVWSWSGLGLGLPGLDNISAHDARGLWIGHKLHVHIGLTWTTNKGGLVTLTFDLLTLKVVSESRVTWATSAPILVFLGLSVLDLRLMYATDVRRRQTRQMSDRRRTRIIA